MISICDVEVLITVWIMPFISPPKMPVMNINSRKERDRTKIKRAEVDLLPLTMDL
jgi:hypothetical protein